MGRTFVEENVLYRRTFCIGGHFVEGRFVEGRLVEGGFVGRTFCSEGRFVLAPLSWVNWFDRHPMSLSELPAVHYLSTSAAISAMKVHV